MRLVMIVLNAFTHNANKIYRVTGERMIAIRKVGFFFFYFPQKM